jgi:pre-mRNA-processing factor 6
MTLFISSNPSQTNTLTCALQEKQQDVIAKCTLSEPKHGEIWQSVAKDPKNAYKTTEEILRIVATMIE